MNNYIILSNFFIEYWDLIVSIFVTALIAVVIFNLQREKINPKFYISNKKLISGIDNMKELKILYKDKVVPNISVSDILFWNKGKKTLNFSDFATGDILRINVCSDVEILDVQLALVPNLVNKVKIIEVKENNVYIQFDYLDKDDGFIIQISHTGEDKNSISVKGTIKGYKQFSVKSEVNSKVILFDFFDMLISRLLGIKSTNVSNKKRINKSETFLLIFAITMLIFTSFIAIIFAGTTGYDITFWIVTILYGIVSLFLFIIYFYVLAISIPKPFQKYFIDSKSN